MTPLDPISPDAVWSETAAAEKALATVASVTMTEQFGTNQLLGRIQATQAISTLLETFSLVQLAQIKESKRYKQLAGQTMVIDGAEIHLDTWDGFCAAIGSSRQAVDEKLQNLRLLGEEALDKATALGMTTQELRKLRQLDAADQQIVIGEIEVAAGDKEAIIDLITDMSAKHAKDREALEKRLHEQEADAKATDRILRDKDKRIAELQKQVITQENRTMDEQAQDMVVAMHRAQLECRKPLPGLDDAIAAALEAEDLQLTRTAANILHELRAAVEDLQLKYGLDDVVNPDDRWMQGGFDPEQAERANELK